MRALVDTVNDLSYRGYATTRNVLINHILAYQFPSINKYLLICRPDGSSSHKDCSQFGLFCIRLAIGRISERIQLKRTGMELEGSETLKPMTGSEGLRARAITLNLILWALFASNFTKGLNNDQYNRTRNNHN